MNYDEYTIISVTLDDKGHFVVEFVEDRWLKYNELVRQCQEQYMTKIQNQLINSYVAGLQNG